MLKSVYAMVIAAHPDDAEFGVAGTVAKWTKEGKDVVYVICTNGDKGTSDTSIKSEDLAILREQEQLNAAKVLGVKDVVFLRHPDQSLEDTPEFRKELVKVIRTYRPEVVATVDPYRRYIWHRDHRITAQVVLDAVFPYARDYLAYPDLYEQGYKPHNVKRLFIWGSEEPNFKSDITETFETKLAALRCHISQVGKRNSGLRERLLERAKFLARGEDFELAEAFHIVEID